MPLTPNLEDQGITLSLAPALRPVWPGWPPPGVLNSSPHSSRAHRNLQTTPTAIRWKNTNLSSNSCSSHVIQHYQRASMLFSPAESRRRRTQSFLFVCVRHSASEPCMPPAAICFLKNIANFEANKKHFKWTAANGSCQSMKHHLIYLSECGNSNKKYMTGFDSSAPVVLWIQMTPLCSKG